MKNSMRWAGLFLGLYFGIGPIETFGRPPSLAPKMPTTTQQLMNDMMMQLIGLKKFMVSEALFVDPKQSPEIQTRLRKFSETIKKAQHDMVLSQNNFRFTRQVLEEHVVDAERVFRLGSKSYARWRLNSAVSVCMNCHTQLPTGNRLFAQFMSPKIFSSVPDQAEFLFSTRAFDQAFQLYSKIIAEFPKNKVALENIETALQRQLAYFVRIQRNLPGGLAQMKAHQKNQAFPEGLRATLGAWVTQLEKLSSEKLPDVKVASQQQIVDFAKSRLAKTESKLDDPENSNLVQNLLVSGILYEFLHLHPAKSASPQILYWLAYCERSIGSSFFYSLASMYLRECMTQAPKEEIAKKCFQDYETEIIFGYTGTSGTHLPSEVKADLEHLRKTIFFETNENDRN